VTIAVLGGGGAALVFGVATLCSARSSRVIGAASALGWVALTGLIIGLPFALVTGVPEHVDATTVAWLAVSGAGNVLGLLLAYRALRAGQVGMVAPIVSTEGAVAALVAVAAGESLSARSGAALAVIAIGVALAGIRRSPAATQRLRAGVIPAAAAALSFGVSLYATGRAGSVLPIAWAVLPPRIVGTAVVTLPLAVAGRLRLTRSVLPLVIISGACEVAGFALFALGARHGIAVAAVLASLFGAVAALLARVVFRERLARVQLAGIATIVAGVATLSLLNA
jgi:drug/metabolite transporter (DMT)-like permease